VPGDEIAGGITAGALGLMAITALLLLLPRLFRCHPTFSSSTRHRFCLKSSPFPVHFAVAMATEFASMEIPRGIVPFATFNFHDRIKPFDEARPTNDETQNRRKNPGSITRTVQFWHF
jgi:hypothetical protein